MCVCVCVCVCAGCGAPCTSQVCVAARAAVAHTLVKDVRHNEGALRGAEVAGLGRLRCNQV